MNAALKPRWHHSLTAFSLGPGLTEVTVFGGSAESPTGSNKIQSELADTTLLQFSELFNDIWIYHYTYNVMDIRFSNAMFHELLM